MIVAQITGAEVAKTAKKIITASKVIDEQDAFSASGISLRRSGSSNRKGMT